MTISNKSVLVAVFIASFTFTLLGPIPLLAAGPAGINLGTAGNFVILAKTGVSTTGSTAVVGDIGVSPAAASYITGFSLNLPAASSFSTSVQVVGKVYASDYTPPTPTNLTVAVQNMQDAYTDGNGRTNPTATELGAGNIGGMTLVPGLYKWSTGVSIPTDLTLSGGPDDVWIFQIDQNLTLSSATRIILSGGAEASNIFWVVAGQTTIGTTALMNGNILDQTAIVLNTGAQLNGRALAQSAVTLDSNTVIMPTSISPYIAPPITPTPTGNQNPTPTDMGVTSNPTPVDVNVVALQSQLNALLVTLQSLQAKVVAQSSSSSTLGQEVRTITVDLTKGSRGNQVSLLQQFLISQNRGSGATALAQVGATGYFGEMTRAALAEFQASVGIVPFFGNFGPITRDYLSSH